LKGWTLILWRYLARKLKFRSGSEPWGNLQASSAMFRAGYRRDDTEPASGGGRSRRAKLGVVLGAGAARGWAHIGAMQELDALGLRPDVVVGSSIGSLVGGCYAAGRLDMLEAFARSLTRRRVLGLLDFSFAGSGLIGGERLRARLEAALGGIQIEDLPIRFAGVATEITDGHEIWLRRGSLVEAIRASYALPGVFDPVKVDGRWLFDGAIVNPVPVSVARALGAERVVAFNISSDGVGRGTAIQEPFGRADLAVVTDEPAADSTGVIARWLRVGAVWSRADSSGDASPPGLMTSMVSAFDILQDRIMRSRLAGDPPDALVQLKVGKIGMFEFHRADELIRIGREAIRKAAAEIMAEAEPARIDAAGA
jgi:NTE family protein